MSQRNCFVLMPFRDPFNSYYEQIIKPAVIEAGMTCLRADEIYDVQPVMQDVLNRIHRSDVVIAELTTRNPNVLYELGIAHAVGKPVLLLSQTMDDVPFDLKQWRVLLYDTIQPQWASDFGRAIVKILNELEGQGRLDEGYIKDSQLEPQLRQSTSELVGRLPANNPFADRMAAWRIKRATDVAHQILSGRVPFTAMDYSQYVGYNFSSIMQLMKKGETYYTISNIEFWSGKGVKDSTFLIENTNAANRGVKINRIILVTKEELEQAHSSEQSTAFQVLNDHYKEYVSSDLTRKNMSIKVFPVDDLGEALNQYSHFGLLVDREDKYAANGHALLVSPERQATSLLLGIKLLFTEGPCKGVYVVYNALRTYHDLAKDRGVIDLMKLFKGKEN